MKYIIVILLFIVPNVSVISQPSCSIAFSPIFQEQKLIIEVDKVGEKSFEIETLKFYISKVQYFSNGELKWSEENSYHLIDATDTSSMNIGFNVPSNFMIDSIGFLLGIDSLTNVAGALDGDLDPTKGMYWTWQNGYINFKLEGVNPDCPTRNQYFQYHLGGYLDPYLNAQQLGYSLESQHLNIDINLDKLFEQVDLTKTYGIMSPGQPALDIAKLVASIFEQRN